MSQVVVYIGSEDLYLSEEVLKINSNATLLTSNNFKNLANGIYYTSLADAGSTENFVKILQQADSIIYLPPDNWSHNKMQFFTEQYLKNFSYNKNIKNFNRSVATNDYAKMLKLADTRKTELKQIWVVGCSNNTIAISENERYGQLLSNELNLPVSFLTEHGSSIIWQADQILRSDIRQDDIVFWGLPECSRLPLWFNDENKVKHAWSVRYNIQPWASNKVPLDYLFELEYQSITNIFQIIKYCKQCNIKLIMATLFEDEFLQEALSNESNYINLAGIYSDYYQYLDFGKNDDHPGPKTHKFFAEQFLKKYKEVI